VLVYRPVLDPVAGSLGLTVIFAALPLLTLFVLLGVLRMRAWLAALISLAVGLLVAVLIYSMPAGQALLAASEGAVFGFFPIMWIVINAIWIYRMTVETGHFDALRRSFASVSDDQRIQGVIIAFCFGALLEALAGFGTPVAITSVMLIGMGFRPIKAATVALVANTAPVAFGALAVPITTLSTVANLPVHDLASMVGRQTPLLGVFVPIALVLIIDGGRGVRQTLPATLTCGVTFALAQFATSNYFSAPLTDIVAALVSAAATVLLLRAWRPAEPYVEVEEPVAAGATRSAGGDTAVARSAVSTEATRAAVVDTSTDDPVAHDPVRRRMGPDDHIVDSRADVLRAYAPYVVIVAVFALAQIPPIRTALDSVTKSFNWPGLHLQTAAGKPSTVPTFKFGWLNSAGTLLLIAGLLTIPLIGIGLARAARAYADALRQLAAAILTVMAVLALAYVMNASGETATLGTWMAGAGGLFAILSPILGWLGVAVTGSDTSSNSLFGALQVTAAQQAGLDPTLMAASNSSGGVLGKMISPQNLAIATAAVGMSGREGDLFRKVLPWSIGFLVLMCLLVYLQSTPVLSWMVP
jgi:lactate permease